MVKIASFTLTNGGEMMVEMNERRFKTLLSLSLSVLVWCEVYTIYVK